MIYTPKTVPFAHQLKEFEATRDLEYRALWWEMGVAKTKVAIDTIVWLYLCGKINGALVLAPKAVVPNWVLDELPAHMPDEVVARTRVVMWRTERAGTQKFQREIIEALAHDGLLIVVMSYDGIMTGTPGRAFKVKKIRRAFKGCHYAKELLTTRRCMFVLDESSEIRKSCTKRTKRVLAAGRLAPYRRILTGTATGNSPFDVYPQVKFLDPGRWAGIGCASFEAFKSHFGIWVQRLRNPGRCPHETEQCDCPKYPMMVDYKNLDDLNAVVASVGSRLLKSEALDLPPKLYQKRYFTMGAEQRKMYDTLKRDFMVMLSSGDMITAPLVITQLLRLQQITSGYCPTDDGDLVLLGDNPRIPLLVETLKCPGQKIVWAKFRQDIDQIMEAVPGAARYDGTTSHGDRERARHGFQAGDVEVFVGNPAAVAYGLTLHAGKTVVYYNNSEKLILRLQSEDRAHRAGMDDQPVTYIDIIAEDTVDEKIVAALRANKELAEIVMGDPSGPWI